MVAHGNAQSKLKIMMAAGVGALFLILGVVGGVVGWFTRDNAEQFGPPQVTMGVVVIFFTCWLFRTMCQRKMSRSKGTWVVGSMR